MENEKISRELLDEVLGPDAEGEAQKLRDAIAKGDSGAPPVLNSSPVSAFQGYEGDNIKISATTVRVGNHTFAMDSVQGVAVVPRSQWLWLRWIGIAFGTVLVSAGGCAGSCMSLMGSAVYGVDWLKGALFVLALFVILTVAPPYIGPFNYIVVITVGGQRIPLYRTDNQSQAGDISDAIRRARGM